VPPHGSPSWWFAIDSRAAAGGVEVGAGFGGRGEREREEERCWTELLFSSLHRDYPVDSCSEEDV